MEIPGGGGKSCQALWNGKSWGVGAQTGKIPPWGGKDIFWNHTFWKIEHDQSGVYHINYKVDAHYIKILHLKVEQEFAGSVTWYRGPIQLFFSTYLEAKHTLLLPLSF